MSIDPQDRVGQLLDVVMCIRLSGWGEISAHKKGLEHRGLPFANLEAGSVKVLERLCAFVVKVRSHIPHVESTQMGVYSAYDIAESAPAKWRYDQVILTMYDHT